MGDEKLPSQYDKSALERAASRQSLLGRVKSAFRARLNTGTILDNLTEAEAYRLYTEELERLAEAKLKKDRAVAHYVEDLGDIIEDDRAAHRAQMELNRLERERKLQEAKQKAELTALEHQTKVTDAKYKSDRAQWGHEAFNKTRAHREERLDHLYRSGAVDAELSALLLDKKIEKATSEQKTGTPADTSTIEKLLELVDIEIGLAEANNADQSVIDAHNVWRARLSAFLEAEKNRPR